MKSSYKCFLCMVVVLLCTVVQANAQEMEGMGEARSFSKYLSDRFGPNLEVSYDGPWHLGYEGNIDVGRYCNGDYYGGYYGGYYDPNGYYYDNNNIYYDYDFSWQDCPSMNVESKSAYMSFRNTTNNTLSCIFSLSYNGYGRIYAVCDGDTLSCYDRKIVSLSPNSVLKVCYESIDYIMYPYYNPMDCPPGYIPDPSYPSIPSDYDGGHGYLIDFAYWDSTNDTEVDWVIKCDEEQLETATVVEYIGSDTEIIVPSKVKRGGKEYEITSLGSRLFSNISNSRNIKSVQIPNTVTSIGSYAFEYCSGLTSITIPNSVTSIGSGAFEHCSGLTSITIPNSVTSIGSYTFYGCSGLTSITIPNSVTSIGSYTFRGCSSLTSITIPNSVTSIGSSAFSGCSSLTSITIPNSVTSIESSAFSSCTKLTSIVVESNNKNYDSRENSNAIINSKTNTLVLGCQNTTIPNTVTSIGSYAFSGCSGLTSITIPNTITSIGSSAFSSCSGLTSITIPNTVTSIGSSAFSYCSNLTSITIPNTVKSVDMMTFRNCSSLTSITIPNSVTSIGSYAFDGCSSLTSITIPNSVTSIGSGAFEYCSSLTSITIPNSVTSIEYGTFEHCSSLTSITIPYSVNSIGRFALSYCPKLETITLCGQISDLSTEAFMDCGKLSSIIIKSNYLIPLSGDLVEHWAGNVVQTKFSSCTLYVPSKMVNSYKYATGWKRFAKVVSLPVSSNYSLYAKDYTACPGKQVKLSLMMENETPITSWQTDIVLPNGFTLAQDDDAVVIAEDRTSGTDISIACNTLADGTIRLVSSSMSNATYFEKYGKVATITLNIASTVKEGEYFITYKNTKLADPSMQKYVIDDNISKINVKRFKVGDLDNDGSVDVADLAGVVNFILEKPMEDYIDAAADVNCDGDINGIDYVAEINQILGVTPASNAKARAVRNVSNVNISSSAVYMDAGSYQSMKIRLDAPNSDYSLMQFDLTLPEGVRIEDNGAYICGAGNMKHNLVVEQVRKNSYRIMMYSASKEKIRAEQGGVISLSLVADDTLEAGDYNVTMFGKLLVDGSGNYIKPSSSSAKLFITDPTFIETAKSANAKSDIYSLDGTLVRKSSTIDGLPKGVYVIEGKKVMVK